MKICYEIDVDGRCVNGRFVKDDYQPQGSEQITNGDSLSILEQYNTIDYLKEQNKLATQSLAKNKIADIAPNFKISKLIRKEGKGNASQDEIEHLDLIDAIQDASDAIKDQVDLDVDYDYENSLLWP